MESKNVFETSVNKVTNRIKTSMMMADITKTGGLVLLKNRTGSIFILDSIKFMKKIRYTKEGNIKIYTKNKIFFEKNRILIFF